MILDRKPCANTRCGDSFVAKNPKKKFCCLSCKNMAAHDYRKKVHAWEAEKNAGRRKNIQLLEYLMNQKNYRVTENELKVMGFNIGASLLPFLDKKGRNVFRFGNIGLVVLSKTEYELINL